MEDLEDKDRAKRRDNALMFCRNVIIFVLITSICATLIALSMNDWDTAVLKSTTMLIVYGIEALLFGGALDVAIFGWQEK